MKCETRNWRERAERHRARLSPFIETHMARRSRAEKHPVWDFLFEYYSFRPAHLLKWSPGIGVEVGADFAGFKELAPTDNGVWLDPQNFPLHRLHGLREVLEILENTAQRPAFHGCNGLHEWAMVYREAEVRHPVALRLGADEIAALVENQTIVCSHYDAFRFFTPAAAPLNVLNPTGETRAAFEQPGCIHANMDLYKWASNFHPWIASEILADAFELAIEARKLDMRAAPYDLAALGFEPIRLENAAGRREYQILQREIAEKAAPVRADLITAYKKIERLITKSAISTADSRCP